MITIETVAKVSSEGDLLVKLPSTVPPGEYRVIVVDSYNPMFAPSFVVKDVENLNEARAELENFATRTWGGRVSVRSENLQAYRAQQRGSQHHEFVASTSS